MNPYSTRAITVVAHEIRSDGGMERAMRHTIIGLLERGVEVTVIARVCDLPSHPRLRWIRVRTPRRPFALAFPAFAILGGVLTTWRGSGSVRVSLGAIVLNRVEVITVQFCHAGFATAGVERAARVGNWHRLNSSIGSQMALWMERWSYRSGRVRRMTAVSELVKTELQAHFPLGDVPIDVVPNGVELQRFGRDPVGRSAQRVRLGMADDRLLLAFVGGDWQRKGLDLAMQAAGRAGWSLVVVGRGDQAAAAQRARTLGTDVHFVGHIPDPERLFLAADAFALPSRYEGFALVTIEAAAAGLPLLVTEATGAGPLVRETGGDALEPTVEAFADELLRLSDPALREARGRAGTRAAQRLEWSEIVEAYERVYVADGSG